MAAGLRSVEPLPWKTARASVGSSSALLEPSRPYLEQLLLRTLLSVFVAVTASAALAGQLPIAENYGNSAACGLYKPGGGNAVYTGGGSRGIASVDADTDDYVLVNQSEVVGLGWGCSIDSVSGNSASLMCSGEGEDFTLNASFQVTGNSLIYSDDNSTVTLNRCD